METKLVMGFMLCVDGKPTAVGTSLDETKGLAEPHLRTATKLRIESAVVPAGTTTARSALG